MHHLILKDMIPPVSAIKSWLFLSIIILGFVFVFVFVFSAPLLKRLACLTVGPALQLAYLALFSFFLCGLMPKKMMLDSWNCTPLKEPAVRSPQDFSHTFGDFGIRRKLVFFLLPMVNFTAGKFTILKILMKM